MLYFRNEIYLCHLVRCVLCTFFAVMFGISGQPSRTRHGHGHRLPDPVVIWRTLYIQQLIFKFNNLYVRGNEEKIQEREVKMI